MSVFSATTGLSSILKAYKATEREKAKNVVINKVRFEIPKLRVLEEAVLVASRDGNFQQLNKFVSSLKDIELNDGEFITIFTDASKVVDQLNSKFTNHVEKLLSLSWAHRSPEAVQLYSDFFVDLMVTHNKHLYFGIVSLIQSMVPGDNAAADWINGQPTAKLETELQAIHKIMARILNAIPMSFDVILDLIETTFPYYKKPTHVIVGYIHNMLWLTKYQPIFTEYVVQLILKKLTFLDVYAPRNEIEETEDDEDDDENDDQDDDGEENDRGDEANAAQEGIFKMDDVVKETLPMNHPIAHTLDMCMLKIFSYLDELNPNDLNLSADEKSKKQTDSKTFLKILLNAFDSVILNCHNTHHVQFVFFYYCSFKHTFSEAFLHSLWDKVKNPNNSATIRQTSVCYVASFLARCKVVPLNTLKYYLKELSDWAHQYIERTDQYRSNNSLKANLVFYAVCQAIFYVVAFRSRDLTANKKNLFFLQSLHLSSIVTCPLNPLRVTLPAVATTFAGVTRTYQLAYCHAVLERNARRKLATFYGHDMETPEETLDTFFPFDPYMLKCSLACIAPKYLQYKPTETENTQQYASDASNLRVARKRGDSEMIDEQDVDHFLLADKRQKFLELARSQEREAQFTYGLSPGFHQ